MPKGVLKVLFLYFQLSSYNKVRVSPPEIILRACIVWYVHFPGAYNHVRNKLLSLPSRQKISAYLGRSVGADGLTPLVIERLYAHSKTLNGLEFVASIAADEMSIDEKLISDGVLGRFFGAAHPGTIDNTSRSTPSTLANRLLSFVL